MPLLIEELSSLVRVVSRNKVKQIKVVGEPSEKESNVEKLYELIASDEYSSEQTLMEYFYSDLTNQNIYYNRLKRKLKDRLLNTLFFIDVNQPNFSDIQKAYYSCYKETIAIKILLGRGARTSAIKMAEKSIKKSIRFEFNDITTELAKTLRLHYSTIEGNKKKYKYFKNIFKKYNNIYQAELLAEEYYGDIAINYVNSQSTKPELKKIAEGYSKELRILVKNHNSYKLNLYNYLIFALCYEIENDFINTLRISTEAIKYLNSKPHLASKPVITNFYIKKIGCNIILKNYDNGEEVALKCLKIQRKGSINWLLTLDYYIILLFHSNQFEKAYDIYLKAVNQLTVDNIIKSSSEHWKVHGAFLQYLIAISKINKSTQINDKFRLSKFLNEVPKHSKDKQGVNIPILIIQILFLLQKGKYGEIIDRTESLKTYVHRYLRRDDTFRSNCFIKMLLCLPAASFHKAGVVRKAKKYVELLKSVPIEEANQSPEVEIIPYEMLWEFVLESLDNKFH